MPKMSEQDIQSAITTAIESAIDYVDSDIAFQRERAQSYFDGNVDLEHEEGRSRVVSTKVRDVVRGAKPSLMRIFMANNKFVEFTPKGPEDVANAEQATAYCHWVFNKVGGYNVLSNAIHDSLVKKVGLVKVWWNTETIAKNYTYENLSDQEVQVLVNKEGVEVVEHRQDIEMEMDEFGIDIERNVHSMTITHKYEEGEMVIEGIPPEEFFIDGSAKSIDDAYICCHRSEKRAGDLIAMGFDPDVVENLSGTDEDTLIGSVEKIQRFGQSIQDDEQVDNDPSMRLVLVTEAYMRIDAEGDGIPTLHKFVCGGTGYEVLEMEPWDKVPFADFHVDPEPHAFYGRSLAELVINDQDTTTSVLRGILDNVALVNTPRLEVNEDMVEMDDVLNNEIGAIIRSEQIGSVNPLTVPFVAGSTLPALQYLDMLVEEKTGISKMSMGLNPDMLQNTSATAAALTAQAGAGQVEVMARNLAEGAKRLFQLMLHVAIKNSPDEQMMRLNGQFVPVDPAVWDSSMDMEINVGLGTGQEDAKAAALMQTFQTQQQIWQTYGPQNGLVSMTQMRNTLADTLELSGFNNVDRYYAPMNPEIEQQIMAQMQEQAAQEAQMSGEQGDPMAQALIQAEQIKAQAS
ncbi:MAG: portal protein, partial [Pseudomonadales bacterium]